MIHSLTSAYSKLSKVNSLSLSLASSPHLFRKQGPIIFNSALTFKNQSIFFFSFRNESKIIKCIISSPESLLFKFALGRSLSSLLCRFILALHPRMIAKQTKITKKITEAITRKIVFLGRLTLLLSLGASDGRVFFSIEDKPQTNS